MFSVKKCKYLTLCMLGNFTCYFCHLQIYFSFVGGGGGGGGGGQINFFKKKIKTNIKNVSQFGSRLGPNVESDLDPNCLDRFPADNKSCN